jgi:hypothetical protein
VLETSLLHICNITGFTLHVCSLCHVFFHVVGVLGNISHISKVVQFHLTVQEGITLDEISH